MLYGLDLTACTGALYLNWQYASNREQVSVKDSDVVVMERFRGWAVENESNWTGTMTLVDSRNDRKACEPPSPGL